MFKNVKGYFITAVIAMSFGSAGAYAVSENLVGKAIAVLNPSGQISTLLSTTKDGEGYMSVKVPGAENQLIATPHSLSLFDSKGELRITIGIHKDTPRIIFFRRDGSVSKVISGED